MNHEELDRLLSKWGEYKKAQVELDAKIEKCRERITKYLRDHDLENYDNANYVAKKIVQHRETVSKQSLPRDIWKQYAITKPVEFIAITRKNAKDP